MHHAQAGSDRFIHHEQLSLDDWCEQESVPRKWADNFCLAAMEQVLDVNLWYGNAALSLLNCIVNVLYSIILAFSSEETKTP
jgi:hypothetical protein